MEQIHIQVSGSVQGVGYRQFVKREARRLQITGWTRNLPDGTVEALLQGEKTSLASLLEKLKEGPFLAEVKDLQIAWEVMDEKMNDFVILPSI